MHPESFKLPVLHLLPLCFTRQLLTAALCGVLRPVLLSESRCVCVCVCVFLFRTMSVVTKFTREMISSPGSPSLAGVAKGQELSAWEAELRSYEGGWKGFVVLVVGL